MIERHPITDQAAWLAMRRRDVTASSVGCLLGVHEYQSAYGMWADKTGMLDADPEETPPMRRGRLLEPVAIALLQEMRPGWRIEQPRVYLRDPDVRLGATPDAYATDPERDGFGIVQVKTVEPGVYRRKWRDEDGDVEPPLWIAVQAIVEAHLAGASWAAVAALTVGFGIDLHVVPVPIHQGVIQRVYEATAAFWSMVDEGRTPDPDYGRDAAIITALFADDDGSEIDLSGDNELPALAAEDAELRAQMAAADKRRKEIRATCLHKLGTAAAARIAGGFVTAKTVHRRGYEVAPASYRRVAFKAAADRRDQGEAG